MSKLKVLELFAGIGACSKALERLEIEHEIVDAVEIDKYAIKSFNAIHNTNFEPQDICEWNKDIQVDLIMHGSPCQDFSLAGKQAGGDKDSGTRSSLMYETIRIVEKLKPKFVIWENVKNLLSKKHIHNFNAYLEKMKSLGYTNYYQVLNAKDYGIPQNRERVFTISILGNKNFEFPKDEECENKIQVVGNYMPSGYDASRIVDENGLAPTVKENHGTVTAVLQRFEFPQKQELKLKLKNMLEDEVDEKYYLSERMINFFYKNEQVQKEKGNGFRFGVSDGNVIAKAVTTRAGGRMDDNFIKCIQVGQMYGTEREPNPQAGRIYDSEGLSPTMDSCSGGNRMPKVIIGSTQKHAAISTDGVVPTLTSAMGQGGGHVPMIANKTICLNSKGGRKGIDGLQPSRKDRIYDSNGIAATIATSDFYNPNYTDDLKIRKLTPKECWRLMGFDDEDFEKAAQVNSNTQLYKQAGNSIVVNVLEAILKELLINE